jgi:hypothetical protein
MQKITDTILLRCSVLLQDSGSNICNSYSYHQKRKLNNLDCLQKHAQQFKKKSRWCASAGIASVGRARRQGSEPPWERAVGRARRQGSTPPGELVARETRRREISSPPGEHVAVRERVAASAQLGFSRGERLSLDKKRLEGVFVKFPTWGNSLIQTLLWVFFIKYSDRTKSVKFIWISSNLINLNQSVPDLQVVGLVLSILQVVGLNCSHGARCGTKIVYTSYIFFTHINLSVRYYLCIEKWNKRPWQCTDIQLVFMQTMNSVLQRVIIQEDENWRLCQEI